MISDAAVMTNPVSRAGPLVAAAEAGGDLAQRAIVHVHRARPQDLLRVQAAARCRNAGACRAAPRAGCAPR